MNKEKYLKNLIKKRFISESKFKKVIIELENNKYRLICSKVRYKKDIDEYIKSLEDYTNQNFLIYPKTFFTTNGFNQEIDLVILDSNFVVIDVFNNLKPNNHIDFDYNFYSILILQTNKARFLDVKPGSKLKIKKFIFQKDSMFNRV